MQMDGDRAGLAPPLAPPDETARKELLTLDAEWSRAETPYSGELVVLRWTIMATYLALGLAGVLPIALLALIPTTAWICLTNVIFTYAWYRKRPLGLYDRIYLDLDFISVTAAIIAVHNLDYPIWAAYILLMIPGPSEHPSRLRATLNGVFSVAGFAGSAAVIGIAGWDEVNAGVAVVTAFLLAFIAVNLEAVFNGNRELKATIVRMAVTDSLTGLSNRRQLSRFMADPPTNRPLAVIIMDVDHFKQYNDAYGHLAGDRLLVRLGEALRGHFPDAAIIGRYGGDEFVVLLPVYTIEEASSRVDALLNSRSRDRVPVSVGVSLWPSHHPTLDAAFAAADDCLRAAKRARRGTYARTDHNGAIHLSDVP